MSLSSDCVTLRGDSGGGTVVLSSTESEEVSMLCPGSREEDAPSREAHFPARDRGRLIRLDLSIVSNVNTRRYALLPTT